MHNKKVGKLIWRAEVMPDMYGSFMLLNIYGTNKMIRRFVLDYQVKGLIPQLIPEMIEEIYNLKY